MNILHTLKTALECAGEKPALLEAGRTLTYRELGSRIRCAANALGALGIRKGDRVAVLMLNSARYLELYYAIPAIGAVIVPMNYRLSAAEIAFIMRDSGSTALVVDDRSAAVRLPAVRYIFAGAGPCPEGMMDYESLLTAAPVGSTSAEPAGDDLYGLFYTSGTTGGAKGVMLTHANIWANTLAVLETYPAAGNEVWLHAAPMFHLADAGIIPGLVLQGVAHCFLPAFRPTDFCAPWSAGVSRARPWFRP
jgi:long-chain acyl-CoA synthetase